MKTGSAVISFVLAMLCAGATARADVAEGIRLLRAARGSLQQGDSTAALTLLDQAYVELPFAVEEEFVYHERADIFAAAGQYVEALDQYGKALHKPRERRARFNSGVLQSRMAEQALQEAGVPLDPAGIPADADPAPLIAVIEENMPLLEESRRQFMESLRLSADASARESVSALTERLDDLAEMLEELRRREEEQEEENEDEEGDENEDEQDEEEGEDEQDEDKEGEDEEQ
ncbi:MAG: tetratricopeptide (TPR) repeat protein, partial [Pseudohongiellaceae bacterium]